MQSVRLSKEKRIDSDVISNEPGDKSFNDLKSKPFILLTIHRRENYGDRLDRIC
jgi:UDP-N-acetylglucosamine 2-epimerase